MPYCITCNGLIGRDCTDPIECASELASCYGYNNEDRVLSELYKAEHPDWQEIYALALQKEDGPPPSDPDLLPF